MSVRFITGLVLSVHLFSCASVATKENEGFALEGRDYLYQKKEWSFSGRMAVSDPHNTLSASIIWQHRKKMETIELSGPFGRGRMQIELSEDSMMIERGGERIHYFGATDELISKMLGIAIPFSALQFWVRGLVLPEHDFHIIEKGFLQSGWKVAYLQMQTIGADKLPQKMNIENNNARLKLVIDQWSHDIDIDVKDGK